MKRLALMAAVLALGSACKKSKTTTEEAPIEPGSTPKTPPPPPPVDAAAPEIDAAAAPATPADGGAAADDAAGGAAPAADAGEAAAAPMDTVRAPLASDLAVYLKGMPTKGKLMATIDTTMGAFHCELYEKEVPMTIANFVGLATGKKPWTNPKTGETMKNTPLYNGLIFHRVIPEFMVQGGDPLGQGTGGPGYEFGDEFVPTLHMDAPGVLAMANAGPGTNGSQFFITEKATPWLDNHHTVFGKCAEGDLVKKITGVPRDEGDKPKTPVSIKKITISRK